ncbi:MAG: hypothetical protein AB7F86_15770 [Bdellovibrionales bacterium]
MKIQIRVLPLLFAFNGPVFLMACASPSTSRVQKEDRQKVEETLAPEVSLKEDREKLAEMRKEIPEEKQQANDEQAVFLNLMNQGTEPPSRVYERFQVMQRKHRASFNAKVKKLRDDYKKEETKRRDEFLKKSKVERDSFVKTKHERKETQDFFSAQDVERREFFADERDRRKNFESEIDSQVKDFNSYMRIKMNEFNEQYRLYSKKYYEKPKPKPAVTGEDEFQKLKKMNATPLGTDH